MNIIWVSELITRNLYNEELFPVLMELQLPTILLLSLDEKNVNILVSAIHNLHQLLCNKSGKEGYMFILTYLR